MKHISRVPTSENLRGVSDASLVFDEPFQPQFTHCFKVVTFALTDGWLAARFACNIRVTGEL